MLEENIISGSGLRSKRTMLSTFVFLAIAYNGNVFANQLPGTGIGDVLIGIEARSMDRGSKLESTTPKEIFGDLKGTKIADKEIPSGERIAVKSFTFVGNEMIDSEILKLRIQEYENKDLTLAEIKDAAREITKVYRESGYFVARAYIPQQESVDGVIKIGILEGVIGNVKLDNKSDLLDDVIVAYTKGVKNERIVLSSKFERRAILLNELSGVKEVKINASAGQKVGESDIEILVVPEEKYSGQVSIDNYGSKYAGKHRVSAIFDINNVSGIGDQFTFAGLLSENANSKSFSADYVMPLGYEGWKLGVYIYNTDYDLSRIGDLISYGESTGLRAWASYPFVKTQEWTSEVVFGGYSQIMTDSFGIKGFKDKSKKQNNSLNFSLNNSLSTVFFGNSGRLYNSVTLSGGNLSNKNGVAKDQDRFAKTSGDWSKIEIFTVHRQRIIDGLSLQTSLKIQENLGRNLDGTEKVSLTGNSGVRSYLSSELNADSGYVASADLIYNIYNDGNYSQDVSLFVDRAEGRKQRNPIDNGLPNYRALNAVGVGYRFEVNDKFDFDATFARGFGGDSSPQVQREFSKSKNKLSFKATLKF